MGDGEFLEQAWQALVQGGIALAAGGVGQGAGEVGFAHARGAGDEDVLMATHPIAGEQATKEGPVQAAGVTVIDVLGDRGLLEARAAQTGAGLAVVAFVRLAFDEQSQTFLEGQGLDIRDLGLLGECLGHTGQTQLGQPFVGGMVEHGHSRSVVVLGAAHIGVVGG